MAYETGVYNDQFDLLEKIATFLDSGGADGSWTVDSFIADTQIYPSGTGASQKRLHIHKTAVDSTVMYFNLKSANAGQLWEYVYNIGPFSGIGLYGSTGYSGAGNWDKEPGFPQGSDSTKSAGVDIMVSSNGTYYFFSSDDTVVICVEYTSGKYQWLSFGQIQKFGSFTGGQFFTGSSSSRSHQDVYSPGGSLYGSSSITARPFYTSISGSSTFPCTFIYLEADAINSWRASYYRADYIVSTTKEEIITNVLHSAVLLGSWVINISLREVLMNLMGLLHYPQYTFLLEDLIVKFHLWVMLILLGR